MKKYISLIFSITFLLAFLGIPQSVSAAGIQVNGNVYIDVDKNGVKDSGENNFQGAIVTISGPEIQTTTTDINGDYLLTVNSGGNYCIELANPSGYTATTNNPICIFPLTTDVTLNFGIVYTAGTMFSDNFTDTDGTLLAMHDNNWVINSGAPKIQNNTLYSETGSIISLPNLSLTDQCASYDALFPLTGAGIYLMIRTSPDGQSSWQTYINPADNSLRLRWVSPFGERSIASADNVNPSVGWHNFKLCAIGNVITTYLDNSILATGVDNHFPQGSMAVLIGDGVYIDNFLYESIATNQLPLVGPLSDTVIDTGDTYSTSGSFSDSDSTIWSATVDYDDGSGVQPLTLSGMNFTLSHQYNAVGIYTVLVSVTDNQGATGTASATVTVNQPQPITVTFDSSGDTNVRNGQANRNYGGGDFMRVQPSGDNRGLVRFDQQELESSISGTVLSAKLRVTIVDNGNNWGATGRTVDVHRLIADWVEGNGTESSRGTGSGVTWNCAIDSIISNMAKNCSGSTEWEMGQPNNPSIHPWVETATDSKIITNNQTGIVEYDVTADVASFLSGANSNYGWIVKKTNESQTGQVSFGTKESVNIPQLVVTYQP